MVERLKLMVPKYFNNQFREHIYEQAGKLGLKGKQAIDILTVTTTTIKEVLQAELKNGNYNGVVTFLKSTPIKAGANLVVDTIIQRLAGRLILRFGLPGSVAVNLALLLVPFFLKRISKKALKTGKVQDLFNTVGVTEKNEKFNILKNQIKEKFKPNQAA
jgi:hypothetical protein